MKPLAVLLGAVACCAAYALGRHDESERVYREWIGRIPDRDGAKTFHVTKAPLDQAAVDHLAQDFYVTDRQGPTHLPKNCSGCGVDLWPTGKGKTDHSVGCPVAERSLGSAY